MLSQQIRIGGIIGAWILIVGALGWFSYSGQITLPAALKSETSSDFVIETLVRNASWQTPFGGTIPYRKGEEVEVAYVVKNLQSTPKKLSLKKNGMNGVLNVSGYQSDVWTGTQTAETIDFIIPPLTIATINVNGTAQDTYRWTDALVASAEASSSVLVLPEPTIETPNSASTENTITPTETQTGATGNVSAWSEQISSTQTPSSGIASNTNGGASQPVTPQVSSSVPSQPTESPTFDIRTPVAFVVDSVANPSDIDFVLIGDKSFRPVVVAGKLIVRVEPGEISAGDTFVAVVRSNGVLEATNTRISFRDSGASVGVERIIPESLSSALASYVVVQWYGFSSIVSVQLSNGVILKNTEFRIISDRVLSIRVPKDLPEGTYIVTVMDSSTIHELSSVHFTVTP